MFRRSRNTVVASMLILYGSVSFCGAGLHGLTHDSESCHHADHPHDARSSIHADPHHDDPGDNDPKDCPVCKFLAQRQLMTEPVRVSSRPLTSPHVRLILVAVATRDRQLACSPRAPPTTPAIAHAAA
jgi:hypothetical protein